MFLTIVITIILILILLSILLRLYLKHLLWGTNDRNNEDNIHGKIVIVTGSNTGIGKETVRELADRGATVVLACRNLESAKNAIEDIRRSTANGKLIPMELDLSSFESIRKFAGDFKNNFDKLDILINNAGVLMPVRHKAKSKDGFEIHFAVNHLGHFLLTNLLLEQIKKGAPSKIITVSSLAHNNGVLDFEDIMGDRKSHTETLANNPLYNNSKLANALFNKELGKRLLGTGVQTYALCPGLVVTEISRSLDIPNYLKALHPYLSIFFKTPKEGAQTTVFCAVSKHKDVKKRTGEFYQHCSYWKPESRINLKDEDAKKLWNLSEQLVGLKS